MSLATYKFGETIFLGNADSLRSQVDKLFDNAEVDTVAFDLENVRLCDSYGLKFLLTYHRKALASGKKLLLLRPDLVLRELFDTIKLSKVFTIMDSVP